jgi:alpha-L-rhamnosidase
MVLGVCPTEDGYKSVRIQPRVHAYDLTWAKGTIPTPHGIITVAWEKADGKLTLEVSLPAYSALACEVVLPDGSTHTQTEPTARYNCKL